MESPPIDEYCGRRLQKEFHNNMKQKLQLMREESIDTDMTLVSEDGQKFPVHKLLLKTGSEYFRKMFDSDFRESKDKEVKIQLAGETLKLVLDFIYFCTIDISTLNRNSLNELLLASDMFHLQLLHKQCWNRALKTLTVDNFHVVWETALMCDKPDMVESIVDFVINNLPAIGEKTHFYELSAKQLEYLLKRIRYFNIPLEMFVVERILSWVRNDVEIRKTHLKTFFTSMDLCTLPEDYVQELLHSEDDLITNDKETSFAIRSQLKMKKISRTNTERGLILTYQLLRFTKQYGDSQCQSIDMESGIKITRHLPFVLNDGMCCAQYKNYVFFVDSQAFMATIHKIPDNQTKQFGLNSVVRYCLETNIAEYKEPIPKTVCSGQACVVNDTLFVVGGNRSTGKSIQCYDILKNMWSDVNARALENMEIKISVCLQEKLMIICYEEKDVYKIFTVENSKCAYRSTLPKGFDLKPHLTVASSDTLYSIVRQESQFFLCMYNFSKDTWTSIYIREHRMPKFVYCVFDVNGKYCIACNKDNKVHLLQSGTNSFQPMKLNAMYELGYFDLVPMHLDPSAFELNLGANKSLQQMKESNQSRLQLMDLEDDDDMLE